MKKSAVIVAVMALLPSAVAVWGQAPPPGPGGPGAPGGPGGPGGPGMMRPGIVCPAMALMMPPPQMFARMGDMLQLTEDQKTKLNTIFQKADTVRGPLAEKARNASEGLRAAALADQCDTGKLQEMAAQAERAEADLVKAEIDNWAQVRTVLTVDQVKKLREMMTPAPGMRPGAGPPPAGAPPRRAPGGGVAPGTRR